MTDGRSAALNAGELQSLFKVNFDPADRSRNDESHAKPNDSCAPIDVPSIHQHHHTDDRRSAVAIGEGNAVR